MANKTVTLLFKRLLRLDMSGSAPPWPLTVWNDDTATWEAVGGTGGSGGDAGRASSPLVRAHRPIGVLGNYLSTVSGELVVTGSGEPITLGALRVYEVPEFILTAEGDVVGIAGR